MHLTWREFHAHDTVENVTDMTIEFERWKYKIILLSDIECEMPNIEK